MKRIVPIQGQTLGQALTTRGRRAAVVGVAVRKRVWTLFVGAAGKETIDFFSPSLKQKTSGWCSIGTTSGDYY